MGMVVSGSLNPEEISWAHDTEARGEDGGDAGSEGGGDAGGEGGGDAVEGPAWKVMQETASYSALPGGREARALLTDRIVQEGRFLPRVSVVLRSLNATKRQEYQSRRHASLHT